MDPAVSGPYNLSRGLLKGNGMTEAIKVFWQPH